MSAQHSLPHEMREYLRTEGAAGEGVPSGRTPRQELHPLQQAAPAQVLPHCVRKMSKVAAQVHSQAALDNARRLSRISCGSGIASPSRATTVATAVAACVCE